MISDFLLLPYILLSNFIITYMIISYPYFKGPYGDMRRNISKKLCDQAVKAERYDERYDFQKKTFRSHRVNFFREKICDLAEGCSDAFPGVLPGKPFDSRVGCPDGIFFSDRGEDDACGLPEHVLTVVIIINFVAVTDRSLRKVESHLPENGDIRIPSGSDHDPTGYPEAVVIM